MTWEVHSVLVLEAIGKDKIEKLCVWEKLPTRKRKKDIYLYRCLEALFISNFHSLIFHIFVCLFP